MTDLKCNVEHCINNSGNQCCRPEIKVAGPCACGCEQTCCTSFTSKDDSGQNAACGCHAPNYTLEVDCTAKNCTYHQENDKCGAEHVNVSTCNTCGKTDCESQTECSTFRMK